MLNIAKHRLVMGSIIRDIYNDVSISSLLGFKGGTCAYFFYGLPRFSVDLDFDLLIKDKENEVFIFEKIKNILKKYGDIKDSFIKSNTIFNVLSYGPSDHNIKIEISTRETATNIKDLYELKEHIGVFALVAKQDYLFASKLAALTSRPNIASRDIYDVWHFAKNGWGINDEVVKKMVNKTVEEQLSKSILLIENLPNEQILAGLGELLNQKEKNWAKNNLKTEAIFALKNYAFAIKK